MRRPSCPLRTAALVLALLGACSSPPEEAGPETVLQPWEQASVLNLLETIPTGTDLGPRGSPSFWMTWDMAFGAAEESLDLAFFYASDAGPGGALDPGRLTRLSAAVHGILAAADRGVAVRFLTDAGFVATYPALLDHLDAHPGVEVRRYTMPALDTEGRVVTDPGSDGPRPGVMHAKYLIADDRQVVLGSANFDWRALEHIQELGLSVTDHDTGLVAAYRDVFDLDWHLAGGGTPESAPRPRLTADDLPVRTWLAPMRGGYIEFEDAHAMPVFSPRGLLPDERLWDLPRLVDAIDGASERVRVQVLTYKPGTGDRRWGTLDDALRRAASRGVDVRLLVADWGKRSSVLPGLVDLTTTPNVEVRFVTIPEDPDGHIPFARVIHSKYLVVDEQTSWVGTSNWSRSYFESGRNVGLLIEGRDTARELAGLHDHLWSSEYAYPVEPGVDYEVPAYGERD